MKALSVAGVCYCSLLLEEFLMLRHCAVGFGRPFWSPGTNLSFSKEEDSLFSAWTLCAAWDMRAGKGV